VTISNISGNPIALALPSNAERTTPLAWPPVTPSTTNSETIVKSNFLQPIEALGSESGSILLQAQETVFTSGATISSTLSDLDLTPSDKSLIYAATGLTVHDNGDISGTALPGAKTLQPPDMLLQISNARQTGAITGDVTAQDFSNFAASAIANNQPWPQSYLQKGLSYLAHNSGNSNN
jgi:hypothetical protein